MKNQFSSKQKGLRQIRDHIRKALSKENPDLSDPLLYLSILTSFFKITLQILPEKLRTSQIQTRLVEFFSAKV